MYLEDPVNKALEGRPGSVVFDNNLALHEAARPEIQSRCADKLKQPISVYSRNKRDEVGLTLLFLKIFQRMIGTMKIGMPTYEAKKSEVDQFPLRKTGNPATRVIMVDPMNPTHAV